MDKEKDCAAVPDNGCNTKETPQSNGMLPRKRRISNSSILAKRQKTEPSKEEHSLVSCPDDVLLIILSYLEHDSLIRLRDTCTLFARLCEDYTFWRNVKFTSSPATAKDVETIGNLIHADTKHIQILGTCNGTTSYESTITRDWLLRLRSTSPALETLALPNHYINCQNITVEDFPLSLTCLDLSNTRLYCLPVGKSYFRDISNLIPNLKRLILSKCDWFEPHSLMAISKCLYLEELRLNDCIQVRDCLAYCGLSTRNGFRALKTLDVRRCMVNTSELVCFSTVQTLVNIYLENVYVGDDYSIVSLDQAILFLCAKNEVSVRGEGEPPVVTDPPLWVEYLAIRHFKEVKDFTLDKLAKDALLLKVLDITGTGVSREAVANFKSLRPNVILLQDKVTFDDQIS